MNRVELKEVFRKLGLGGIEQVPNEPCGVESSIDVFIKLSSKKRS